MCNPFACCYSYLYLMLLSSTHLVPQVLLLALTGLQPPLCSLINGLNRPPTMDLKKGLCVFGRGRLGGHMTVQPVFKEASVPLISMIMRVGVYNTEGAHQKTN